MRKSKKDKNTLYLVVGIFVSVSLAIFLGGVFLLSKESSLFEEKYIVKSYFKNTAGLLPGAYVRLSGVRIGTVTRIAFPKSPEKDLIEVTMEVNKEGMQRITPDSKATIRTEGLLGAKYIEIIRGKGPPRKEIPREIVIESYTPPELQEIIGQSGELMANIISISKNLDEIVKAFGNEENLENINDTLLSLKMGSEALMRNLKAIEEKKGIMHRLIYDEDLAYDLKISIVNIKKASQYLSSPDGIMTNLKDTSRNLKEISEMLKEGEGTLGALLVDPSIYDSIKGVLGEAERSRFVRAAVRYLIENSKQQ